MCLTHVIERQAAIATNEAAPLNLPKFTKYAICNLRGGVGKTTISFNLSFLANNLLAVDTCPQGNLSYFFDRDYFGRSSVNVSHLILPHIIPGITGQASHAAVFIGATNRYFHDKNNFFIPSASTLYMLPSQLITALGQTRGLPMEQQTSAMKNILLSLRTEIEREMTESKLDKCLVDTSPFFSGATHLAWHAVDALVVPVRTDQQSISSLELLLTTLQNPDSEFRRYGIGDLPTPRIQMVVLTHCDWSTTQGARNEPSRQTLAFVSKAYDLISRYRNLFTTDNPEEHLILLDDFRGSGRISSGKACPMALLQEGATYTLDRQRVSVTKAIHKCNNQLEYLYNTLW